MATPKSSRRQERIFAFRVLYGLCFTCASSLDALRDAFMLSPDRPKSQTGTQGFAWDLVKGVWENQQKIDTSLESFSQNWRLDRMGKIELTLLRIAVFELTHRDDIPPKVVLNEAIELSKLFGDDNSHSFINGILDATAKAVETGQLSA